METEDVILAHTARQGGDRQPDSLKGGGGRVCKNQACPLKIYRDPGVRGSLLPHTGRPRDPEALGAAPPPPPPHPTGGAFYNV